MEMIYVADFETLSGKGKEETYVWLGGVWSVDGAQKFQVRSIREFIKLCSLLGGSIIYMQNLAFDGMFILDFLERNGFKKGLFRDQSGIHWKKRKKLLSNEYSCYISRYGLFYEIDIRFKTGVLRILDSMKLLPMSIENMAESFGMEIKKLSIDYEIEMHSDTPLTKEQQEYFNSDMEILRRGIDKASKYGVIGSTIGSCAMKEYIRSIGGKREFDIMFPDLTEQKIDKNIYNSENVYEYVRKSYKGSFNYTREEKTYNILGRGFRVDANSMFMYVMHSKSGNDFCYGRAKMGSGKCKKKKIRDITKELSVVLV